jgi:hypothetical protein
MCELLISAVTVIGTSSKSNHEIYDPQLLVTQHPIRDTMLLLQRKPRYFMKQLVAHFNCNIRVYASIAFPPHDPSDAGSIPAEVVEFFRAEKFGNEVLRKGL